MNFFSREHCKRDGEASILTHGVRWQVLEQALDQLPEELSATLRLRFYQSMTFKEAAEAFGIPPDQVRKRECEALQSLRKPGKQTDQLRAFLDERTPFYNAHGVHSVERLVLKRERIAAGGK